MSDDKGLGGKGRLTGVEIYHLQTYYGKAIRNNLDDVNKMSKAVWATFYHRLSTDAKPQHDSCPTGEKSWCKYNKAIASGTVYTHNNPLPETIGEVIKPIYSDLTKTHAAYMGKLKTLMRVY